MTPDFKAIARRIGGIVFFDDPEFSPSRPDTLLSAHWDEFLKDMEREMRKEFGGKRGES